MTSRKIINRLFYKDRKKQNKSINILSTVYIQEILIFGPFFLKKKLFFHNSLIFIDKIDESFLHLARSKVIHVKCYNFLVDAKVAQLVEQLICNQLVIGSIPIFGS